MAVRPVLLYPNVWLRAKAQEVDLKSDPWRDWVRDLWDTLDANPGTGLAASQIGILRQIVVVDETRFRNPPKSSGRRVWINPRIENASGKTTAREGCLSVPGYLGETIRARKVTLRFWDPNSSEDRVETLRGFPAIVAQHEVDHTRGIVFLDRLVHPRDALRLRLAGWSRPEPG